MRSGTVMMIAGWLLLAALIAWVVQGRLNPNADLLMTDGVATEVTLKRGLDGHYSAPGLINGQRVEFLVDTGASVVAIPTPIAQRLNLPLGTASLAHTANGTVQAYNTRLAQVTLGGITAQNVAGSVLPSMANGDAVLLGMSFLARFDIRMAGDEMHLTPRGLQP
jgi:aspartyl protease family protein